MAFGIALLVLAGIAGIVAWIWLIVLAFRLNDKLWGTLMIVGIFLPVGPLFPLRFIMKQWDTVRTAGTIYLSAMAVSFLGAFIFYGGAKSAMGDVAAEMEATAQASAAQAARAAAESAPAPVAAPAAPKPAPRPEAPPRPAPATGHAASSRGSQPAPSSTTSSAPAVASNPSPTTASDLPPIRLRVLDLGEAGANRIRNLRLELANPGSRPVRELKLDLNYLDAGGQRIGGWRTVHSDTAPLAQPNSTNAFELMAFFVPGHLADVRLEIEAVVFTDGTRWPESP